MHFNNGCEEHKYNDILLCVHIRSELSDQITGSHSLSMGKSDQSVTSDHRYQRQNLSDQSDQKVENG